MNYYSFILGILFPVRIEPDNGENLLFGIPVCTGEYWGMSNPVCARFPQSQKSIGQRLGPNILWYQRFHFHDFVILFAFRKNYREVSLREMGIPQAPNLVSVRWIIGVRWVPPGPENQ